MKKLNHLIAAFFLTASISSYAQGNLLVTPVRVTFEGNKTREDLSISNIGKDTAVYVISFLKYRMNENGSFSELDKNDNSIQYADEYLRIFPRKVTLPPNESQTIRLQFRKQGNMKDGEIRSHLYFRAEKELTPLGMKDPNVDSTKMSVRITPIFGISIPVIIRQGDLKLNVKISDVSINSLNDSISQLTMHINREGNQSAYGNIRVIFHPDKGKPYEVGIANGVGVYTELSKRIFNLRLMPNQQYRKGKLVITYTTPFDEGNIVLGKTEYILN